MIYDQTDNLSGFGVSSQNFEPSLDAYDNAAADDFKLTSAATVTTVVVEGFDSPGGNFVTSATVTFYKNAHGLPGAVKKSVTKPVDDDGIGDLTIDVGTIKLKRGTYWLSVVANEDYLPYEHAVVLGDERHEAREAGRVAEPRWRPRGVPHLDEASDRATGTARPWT